MIQLKVCNRKQCQLYESIIAKFIINLPPQERKDDSRLSYHAEKAWYYYLDSVLQLKDDSSITSETRYQFFEKLSAQSPKILGLNPELITQKLAQNKPTCGAIILNEAQTKVLVIKNKHQQFGFPKGKWNESQSPEKCAVREVYEQIGIYIEQKIDRSQKIEFLSFGSVSSIFFVVRGVKQSQKFTIDYREIMDVFWMNINDVTRHIKRFVSKSKYAWRIFLDEFPRSKLTIDNFIEYFKPKNKSQKYLQNSLESQLEQKLQQRQFLDQKEINPFLNFKLDRAKLMKVFT